MIIFNFDHPRHTLQNCSSTYRTNNVGKMGSKSPEMTLVFRLNKSYILNNCNNAIIYDFTPAYLKPPLQIRVPPPSQSHVPKCDGGHGDIDDVLSLNNSKCGDFVDRIYAIELEIKDATYAARSALYLDLHLEIESEDRLRTKVYDEGRFQFELSICM